MKIVAKILMAFLFLGGMTAFQSCSDDDDGGDDGSASDPNVFCNESLCANNADLKQQCVNAFNSCIANNPDANDDECVATALLICNI